MSGQSRKALLTGAALGAAGAVVARPAAARAADGGPLLLGASNTADQPTLFECTNVSYDALDVTASTEGVGVSVTNSGAGIAVYAEGAGGGALTAYSKAGNEPCILSTSDAGNAGVYAESVAPKASGGGGEGVYAQSGVTNGTTPGLTRSGVHGVCDSQIGDAVWGEHVGAGYGVVGSTTSTSTAGVRGVNAGTGYGVRADSNGTGLYAEGTEAAIEVVGTAMFSESGVAIVLGSAASPKSKVAVQGVTLTPNSFVLATVQQVNGDAQVKQAVPNVAAGAITIYLTAPVTVHVKVGWFVIN